MDNMRLADEYAIVETGLGTVQVSSVYDPSHGADRLRLNYQGQREGSSGWCPAFADGNQWIQLSSEKPVKWNSIHSQGRGNEDQWVTSYSVSFTLDGVNWEVYDQNRVFIGNIDRHSVAANHLNEPLIARSIKICPLTFHNYIAMRVEAFVSEVTGGIPDNQQGLIVPAIESGLPVSVSSVWSPQFDVSRIRLNFHNNREGGTCWVAAAEDQNQWVQISSLEPRKWIMISTQGRADEDHWVTTYYITFSINGRDWHQAQQGYVFQGNYDRNTVVTNTFQLPFIARVVRIHPINCNVYYAMRLELYYEGN